MRETTDQFWDLLQVEHEKASLFCRKLCRDNADGDDLYQDSVLRAISGFDRLRDPNAFRFWFYRIVINSYRSRVRSRNLRNLIPLVSVQETLESGENIAAQSTARRRLNVALAAISPRDRALLILHDLEGWPLNELADLSQFSVDALKARLSRARRKSKKALLKSMETSLKNRPSVTVGGDDRVCTVTKQQNE